MFPKHPEGTVNKLDTDGHNLHDLTQQRDCVLKVQHPMRFVLKYSTHNGEESPAAMRFLNLHACTKGFH